MKRIVSTIAAVAVGLWLTSASALGLGEIDVRSHLNQRFDAVIALTSIGADEVADLRVSLASAEDFARAGLERTDYLSSLRFTVRNDGTPRIEISSDKLEREPYLQLLLEVHAGGSRILRQYTVLLDPPGMAPAKPAAVAPVPIAPSAAEPATPAPISAPAPRVSSEPAQSIFVEVDHPTPPPDERPIAPRSEPVKPEGKTQQPTSAAEAEVSPASNTAAAAPLTGELYGPVKAGETLWSIATRVRGDNTGISMDQVLLSLYNSNPSAFDGGGVNGLKRGAMLGIPAAADMRALDAVDAHREVARLRGLPPEKIAPRARKPVIEPVRITPPPPTSSAAEVVHAAPAEPATAAKSADADAATAATATPSAPSASDNSAALADSESSTPSTPAQANNSEAAPESGAATADIAATDSVSAATPEAGSAAPQVAVPTVEPVKPVKAKKTESLLQALLIPLILGLLLLFLLAWLFARWRARRATPAPAPVKPPARMPLSTPSASEAAIAGAAAVAAATTQKLTPQEELDRLQASISGRTQDVDTQQLQTQQLGVDAPRTIETASSDADLTPVDFDLTGQFAAQTVQIDLDANDPVSEADFHLAYGLYDEAALLLRQAAEKEPQRNDIGIKLAETYFAAGKTAEFAQTAAALKPKVSASEWQKLAIMGQQLDPGAAQFSDMEAAPQHKDLDPGFDIDATTASVPAASSAEPNALDFNFDSEPTPAAGQDLAAPMNLQADNGLDFKLDDLELPSLDVDKHDVANAPPVIDSGALNFDLGSFDATPAPTVAAAEPVAHDASATLDFDLGDFDVGANASASPAAEPAAETPIEEFDFGAVSTESGDLAGDEAATKLDLARAYLEMGDNEMARGLLDEVLEQGNAQQKQDAKSLVERLA